MRRKTPHIGIDARMFSASFTGIGRYTHELIARLCPLRPDWRFTVFLSPEGFTDFSTDCTHIRKVLAPEGHYSWGEQTSFWRRIERAGCDLMHFPHFNAPLLYRKACIVTIHDLTISFFPGKKKTSWIHQFGYRTVLKNIVRKAARIIAVSEHTQTDLQKILRTPTKKVSVIWNGLGEEFLRERQNPLEMAAMWSDLGRKHDIQKPYLLYTGVHREHKNVVGLIRAFQKFLQRGGDAELVITGKEDPFYPEVRETIASERLEQSVKLVGLVSEAELRTLFYQARLFVFPSFYEGFGLPPLEAMAMEIPVIASNVSAIPEVCGPAAEYFNPYDIDDMADKMDLVMRSEKKRTGLITAGKDRIKLFSWDTMARETLKVYEEVLFPKV